MLTREQILTLPAEQLAEVSARMMGWEDDEGYWASYDAHGVMKTDVYKRHDEWQPHTDHNDAGWVADWVLPRIHEIQDKARFRVYKALEFLFDEIGEDSRDWNLLFHTPEQLTRASLLAFVDNGGEIE